MDRTPVINPNRITGRPRLVVGRASGAVEPTKALTFVLGTTVLALATVLPSIITRLT
jgi:hypothetical protein